MAPRFHFYARKWKRNLLHQYPKAAAPLVTLYLPEENHYGGSSEPAWVASSWVLTPPTQSCPPPLLRLCSPSSQPRGRGSQLGSPFQQAPRMLAHRRGQPFFSPGCCSQAATGVWGVVGWGGWGSDVWTKEEKCSFGAERTSDRNPFFDSSVATLLETRLKILRKYCCCCCLFSPAQSEQRSLKVAELPFWPAASPPLIGGQLKPSARRSAVIGRSPKLSSNQRCGCAGQKRRLRKTPKRCQKSRI